MSGSVQIIASLHGRAILDLQVRHSAIRPLNADNSGLLSNFASERLGMSQQDVVVECAVNLKRRPLPLPLEFRRPRLVNKGISPYELEIPELRRFAPSVGRTDLDREVRRFHLVPTAHLIQDL